MSKTKNKELKKQYKLDQMFVGRQITRVTLQKDSGEVTFTLMFSKGDAALLRLRTRYISDDGYDIYEEIICSVQNATD